MQSSAAEARYYIANDERISALFDQYPNIPSNQKQSFLEEIIWKVVPDSWQGDESEMRAVLTLVIGQLKRQLKKYAASQSGTKLGWLGRLLAKIFG